MPGNPLFSLTAGKAVRYRVAEPQEDPMSNHTADDTNWRDHNDRDAHQSRLAAELAAEQADGNW